MVMLIIVNININKTLNIHKIVEETSYFLALFMIC
jgi:hypothetical protein